MKFYFSGLCKTSNAETLKMLVEAQVKHFLLDWADWEDLKDLIPSDAQIFLDSGAYKNRSLTPETFIQFLENQKRPFIKVAAPDIRGDSWESYQNWKRVRDIPTVSWVPVWVWDSSLEYLEEYLDDAPVVGVGNLVNFMRLGKSKNSTDKAIAVRMLDELYELCSKYPNRLHIFGINWIKAVEILKDVAISADTSHWLCGAKYGQVIFQNTRTLHLQQAPARCIPQYANLDRWQRCVHNAVVLNSYCNE